MKKKYKKYVPNFLQLQVLWNIYLDYYYTIDPKAGLEDWDQVFNDFLEKPEETLEYWKHYTSFSDHLPEDKDKWEDYEKQWEIKLDQLQEKLPITKEESKISEVPNVN